MSELKLWMIHKWMSIKSQSQGTFWGIKKKICSCHIRKSHPWFWTETQPFILEQNQNDSSCWHIQHNMATINLLWLWEELVLSHIILCLLYCIILSGGLLSPSFLIQLFIRISDVFWEDNSKWWSFITRGSPQSISFFFFFSLSSYHWTNPNYCKLLYKTTAVPAAACYKGVVGTTEIIFHNSALTCQSFEALKILTQHWEKDLWEYKS